MILHYSIKKLITIFSLRFVPTIPFFFLALGIGEVFWIGIGFLWGLLIGEMAWYILKGYRKVDQEQLQTFGLFNPVLIKRVELKSILSYNNEWAFRTLDTEIRVNRNFIKKSQRKDFDRLLAEIQAQVKMQNQE